MACRARFEEFDNVLCVLAEDVKWPSPANCYIIPQNSGYAMVDVGCGGSDAARYLEAALNYWRLRPADCRTGSDRMRPALDSIHHDGWPVEPGHGSRQPFTHSQPGHGPDRLT